MVSDNLFYSIALSMVPGIGHIKANKLVEHCGSAKVLFQEFPKLIYEMGSKKESYRLDEILALADNEIEFMLQNNIKALNIDDQDYPKRLSECADRPLVLYTKGQMDLNNKWIISIVGSRNASIRGKEICKKLVQGLAAHDPLIVSGLAHGIDVTAHRASLDAGLNTVGVLGSGLKIIYPHNHSSIAQKMQEQGGIISDYPADTKLLPSQFAERNRIVAGLADATIVVESRVKGGSMITAGLALDYDREVYAVPGRPNDELSSGCNFLIKKNKAALVESAKDVAFLLGMDDQGKGKKNVQQKLLIDLSEEERKITDQLHIEEAIGIDEISIASGLESHKTSVILLELEFKGIVRSLPGKRYLMAN